MTTSDIQWSMEIESVNGATKATLGSDTDSDVHVYSWNWETRFDVMAAIVTLEVDDAVRFYSKYSGRNPFGMGAKLTLYFEGIQKFIGYADSHKPRYGPNGRTLIVTYKDRAGLLNHAAMKEENSTKVRRVRMQLAQKDSGSTIFFSPDFSGSASFPWAEEYLVPVFSGTDLTDPSVRIPLSEYEILYDLGAIAWRNATVRYLGDSSSGIPFNNVDAWAQVPFYDISDETMRISNILARAFEYPQFSGGLGWVSGTDYEVQATPNDVLNRLKWVTDESDGSIADLVAWLYDNPAVGLAPSYQIHDYDGQGKIEAKLLTQDASAAKDVEFVLGADIPSSIANIYSRITTTNNIPTRNDATRDSTLTIPPTWGTPTSTTIGEIYMIRDYTVNTAFGFFEIGKFDLDEDLPQDEVLAIYSFAAPGEKIDTILLNATYLWTGQGDDGFLPTLDGVVNSIKVIHSNMIVTVEWTPEASPAAADWYPIHPNLYLVEMDVLGGRDSWIIVEDIGAEDVRKIRLVINQPLFAKVGESNPGEAERGMFWFINEFRALSKGKVTDLVTGEFPEIRFVTDSGSTDRYRPDLSDNVVNGGFSTDSDWEVGSGWVIQNGKANKNADGTARLAQATGNVSGTRYILEYEISDLTAGNVTAVVGGTSGTTQSADARVYEIIQASGVGPLGFYPSNTARFKIDNVKLTEAIDMYRPKLTDKLSFMGIPWKSLPLEVPDVYDFSGSGSVGNRIMTTQLDFYSKENHFEVEIIAQPNIKLADTVWCSKLNTNKFMVVGQKMSYNGLATSHFITLTDFETKIEGGA